jgi:heat shock protein HslJ
MRTRHLTLVLVAAVALAGCGVDDAGVDTGADDGAPATDTAADTEDPGEPVSGEWLVDRLTVDGARIELDPSWPITVTVDADTISGTAACNRYTGVIDVSFEAGHGRFVVSDLSWTEMACEPPAMEIEQAFLSALQAVDSYESADGLSVAEAGVGTNFHLTRAGQVPPPDTTEQAAPPAAVEGLARGGGLDGPVMYAALVDGAQDQMDAEIIGTLELDGDCLYTAFEGNRYPVLWPYGTTWDEDTSSVALADGTKLALGGEVYGGGGYLYPDTLGGLTTDERVLDRAEQCAEEPYFEIAVLQST